MTTADILAALRSGARTVPEIAARIAPGQPYAEDAVCRRLDVLIGTEIVKAGLVRCSRTGARLTAYRLAGAEQAERQGALL